MPMLFFIKTRFRFGMDDTIWDKLLETMESRGGWEPLGTQHSDPEWDGRYSGQNNGQLVSEADAKAMAQAIEEFIPDLPTTISDYSKLVAVELENDIPGLDMVMEAMGLDTSAPVMMVSRNPNLDPMTFFGGESDIRMLQRLVEQMEQGMFQIF